MFCKSVCATRQFFCLQARVKLPPQGQVSVRRCQKLSTIVATLLLFPVSAFIRTWRVARSRPVLSSGLGCVFAAVVCGINSLNTDGAACLYTWQVHSSGAQPPSSLPPPSSLSPSTSVLLSILLCWAPAASWWVHVPLSVCVCLCCILDTHFWSAGWHSSWFGVVHIPDRTGFISFQFPVLFLFSGIKKSPSIIEICPLL